MVTVMSPAFRMRWVLPVARSFTIGVMVGATVEIFGVGVAEVDALSCHGAVPHELRSAEADRATATAMAVRLIRGICPEYWEIRCNPLPTRLEQILR
ncbi:hypothetical protein GCM10009563_05090 [Subtercola frigoramans]